MPLAEHFIAKHSLRYGRGKMSLDVAVEAKLKSYGWPGNIRELSHMMERAVLLAPDEVIKTEDIQLRGSVSKPTGMPAVMPFMTLEQAELQLLQQALDKTGGLANEAADLLGISRSAIYRRMEKYGIKT